MREFFKGRRRKAGCVMLVIACVFAGFRARSGTVVDIVATPPIFAFRLLFLSFPDGVNFGLTFESENHFLPPPQTAVRDFFGMWFTYSGNSSWHQGHPKIPHWVIVIPSTLLSAWLLLGKPRSAIPRTSEPASTERE